MWPWGHELSDVMGYSDVMTLLHRKAMFSSSVTKDILGGTDPGHSHN